MPAVAQVVAHGARPKGPLRGAAGAGASREAENADDPGAVVDGGLRVDVIDDLWVVDASVLPTAPHGNTNLSAVLVGEVGAASVASA